MTSVGRFSKIKFGTGLTVIDEGGGVILVNASLGAAGKPRYKDIVDGLPLVGYWSCQQTGASDDDVLNNEAEGASGFLEFIEGAVIGVSHDGAYGAVGPSGPDGELARAIKMHPGAHAVLDNTTTNREQGSWGSTLTAFSSSGSGTDSVSGVMDSEITTHHPFTWMGWVYMEDVQWSSAAPIWYSGRASLSIWPQETGDATFEMTGFPTGSRATSDNWVIRFSRHQPDLSGGTFIDSSPIDSKKWFLLTAVYDGTDMLIYANDSQVASGPGDNGNVSMGTSHTDEFSLGYSPVLVSGFPEWAMYFAGDFSGVCFFDDALTSGDVAALYDSIANPAVEPGQVVTVGPDGKPTWDYPFKVTVDGV